MFKLSSSKRRQERVWKILKESNSELTRDKFDGAYASIDNLMTAVAKLQK